MFHSNISLISGPDFYYDEVGPRQLRERIKYLSTGSYHIEAETDLVYRVDGEVAGVAGMWDNPYNKNVVWMVFLSVAPAFKNQGIGTALAAAVARYVILERKKILQLSSYTEEGWKYLAPVFERLKALPEYSGKILTRDGML